MNDEHPRVAIVTGSDHAAACLVADRACGRAGLEVDLIDLEAACLPDLVVERVPVPPAVRDLTPWLVAADGFVVVACRPCLLRKAVGWCGEAWRAKPVALVTDTGSLRPALLDRMLDRLIQLL